MVSITYILSNYCHDNKVAFHIKVSLKLPLSLLIGFETKNTTMTSSIPTTTTTTETSTTTTTTETGIAMMIAQNFT